MFRVYKDSCAATNETDQSKQHATSRTPSCYLQGHGGLIDVVHPLAYRGDYAKPP